MTSGKKGAQLQLQAEINTDEEWQKFIEKEGLIVVDVYSEWCGPCMGMVGNLKKLKLEVGGDNLHLAIAKSDGIDCLKRFRKRSEPTWMFIAGGHIVNLMFGADAPKLNRLIIQELENEAQAQKNERERVKIPFEELTPTELARKEIVDKKEEEILKIEEKAAKEAQILRFKKRSEKVAPFVNDMNVLLFWPHAIDGFKMVSDGWDTLAISLGSKETAVLNDEQLAELFVCNPEILGNEPAMNMLKTKPCFSVLLKQNPDKGGDIIEKVKSVVYNMAPKSELTQTGDDETVNEEDKNIVEKLSMINEENVIIPGLYTPDDVISKAAAIDVLFPKIVVQFLEPDPPPPPPHLAFVFDAFKRKEVLAKCSLYEGVVLKLGFFTSGDTTITKNIVITPEEYENNHLQKEYGEKLVLMVSKINKELVFELGELGPTYVSPNAVIGEKECSIFFPPGYGEKPKEVKQVVKRKRGRKKIDAAKSASADKHGPESEKLSEQDINTEVEENGDKIDSDDGTEVHENDDGDNDEEITPDNEDKITTADI